MKKSSFTTPLAAKWSKCGVENEAIGGGGIQALSHGRQKKTYLAGQRWRILLDWACRTSKWASETHCGSVQVKISTNPQGSGKVFGGVSIELNNSTELTACMVSI